MLIRIVIFLTLPFIGFAQKPNEWKKALDKDGIVIHTRHVDGSPFHEFLAETKISGTIQGFKKIFSNVTDYEDWMPDCKSAELIGTTKESEFTYYMEINAPFPVANRYTMQCVQYVEKFGELTVNLTDCENCQPPDTESVRIESAYGSWIVKQENDNEISIRFQYFADPGGDLPAWLVNSFIVKSPYQTLINLRELIDTN
jgi:hypothetical protein